ncbi:helix-turn-helix transcriptional regulator [Burkholderia sp. D-99]|uniref:helix-turn-helix transcriptional regulator n=1 Tax=unclassified Burkholderia TaxID=2613784 RepID=UPI00141E31E3|nr:YafY family protein [Burkholderia sp. D-99]MBZ5790692.1 YafY family transcriptional regulator [Burkholderia contaminans]NHV28557.1 YafY family transcriptional regulator [Burkholderia sp. D-99]
MARSERLLALLQALRCHRQPVSGQALADELGVSVRTIYRDIASLQSQGASIDAAAGMGYVLRSGYILPPLMFSEDEIEALVLGSRWVSKRADAQLASAATNAIAKIAAVIPDALRDSLDSNALLVGPRDAKSDEAIDMAAIRRAIRLEHKLSFHYTDGHGEQSLRTVWPIALGFFEDGRILVAWCERRMDFRHFRTDRMTDLASLGQRYPRRKQTLLATWRKTVAHTETARR